MIGYVLGGIALLGVIVAIGVGLDQGSPILIGSGVSCLFVAGFYILLGQIVCLLQRLTTMQGITIAAKPSGAFPNAPSASNPPGQPWVVVIQDPYGNRSETLIEAATRKEASERMLAQGFKVLSVSPSL